MTEWKLCSLFLELVASVFIWFSCNCIPHALLIGSKEINALRMRVFAHHKYVSCFSFCCSLHCSASLAKSYMFFPTHYVKTHFPVTPQWFTQLSHNFISYVSISLYTKNNPFPCHFFSLSFRYTQSFRHFRAVNFGKSIVLFVTKHEKDIEWQSLKCKRMFLASKQHSPNSFVYIIW